MRRLAAYLALTLAAGPAVAQPVDVPSGIKVTRHEILEDMLMDQLWLRFRYIAPRIGKNAGQISSDVASIDIDHLCQEDAVPHILAAGLEPYRVVVSMSDRVVEFGVSDPEATQFFGSYRVEDGRCIWEEF